MSIYGFFALPLVFAVLAACTTTGSQKPAPGPSELGKAGRKTEPHQPASTPQTPAAPSSPVGQTPIVVTPTPAELFRFVRTHTSPTSSFSAKDHDFLASLSNSPASGTVEEAALALGLVKAVLHPMNFMAPTFEETDIGGSDGSAGGKSKLHSLEAFCDARGVNLAKALSENPLLATAGVARQALDALERGVNSPEFQADVALALRNQAAIWLELAGELDQGKAPPAPASADIVAPEQSPPNSADLRGGDAALSEAQSLADRGEYQAAIKRAAMVAATDPLYAEAQEKMRDFANRAVQDLRRKAAQSFQNALPLTDGQTRAAYLRQAKAYLEEALRDYPQASQLPTVRDNLRVISRDLEKLDTDQKQTPKPSR